MDSIMHQLPEYGYNILHVTNVFFGVPYFFGDQFRYFENKGYNIHLICSPSEYISEYAHTQGISYKEIPVTRAITPITDVKSIIKTIIYIKKHNINTVVGHTTKGGFIGCIAAKLSGVRNIIYFRHGIPYDRRTGIKKIVSILLEQFISLFADKIVCTSPSLAKLSQDIHLNRASKQTILGYGTCGGIDTINKFNPDIVNHTEIDALKFKYGINEDDFVIGYCGRLEEDKGIYELIDGFSLLCNKHPGKHLKLLLVGCEDIRFPLSPMYKNAISANANIIATGYIRNNLQYYYGIMDIGILPSFHEGFGMCMLEAQAMGKPVLTTKSFGCVDSIIENKTGFYVDISPKSICDGIERYFDDEIRRKMGKDARIMVRERFDNLKIWPYIEELY